jgi:hypothetical protein
MRFPNIHGHDLEETAYEIPDGLPRGYRVILLPFKQWQQILVGQWQEAMAPALAGRDDVTAWEVPALSGLWKMARPYIDGGMRAGIPDIDVRRHTLTSYGELDVITETLGITSFETIQVFLLDDAGEIVWRDSGEPDAAKAAAFAAALGAGPGVAS